VTVFFTSDTHFGDHRVLNLYPRPFATVAEMDAELVRRWNEVVGPQDEVWHLGDFARTAKHAAEVLAQLNGTRRLIVGNNDPGPEAVPGWASVAPYAEIELEERKLVLCHYPFRSWNGQHKGSLDLHGHSHGRIKELPRQFDVGVDVWEYRPVTLAEILSRERQRGGEGTVRAGS
jgi:calcineurin-like phosphoesterase family protein